MNKRDTNGAPVRFRPAVEADLGAIVALEVASFRYREEMFNRRQVRELIANPRAMASVAVCDGRVVGWAVGLARRHGAASQSGRVYGLAVHPEMQGRRIGWRLMERTLRSLTRAGTKRVFLEVRVDNAAAIALYQRMGFVHHEKLRDYYGRGRHGLRLLRVFKRHPKAADQTAQHLKE